MQKKKSKNLGKKINLKFIEKHKKDRYLDSVKNGGHLQSSGLSFVPIGCGNVELEQPLDPNTTHHPLIFFKHKNQPKLLLFGGFTYSSPTWTVESGLVGQISSPTRVCFDGLPVWSWSKTFIASYNLIITQHTYYIDHRHFL